MAAEESSGGVRSVARALDILALVGDEPTGVTLRDAVASTGLPKTTVLRLLQSLEARGLIWNVGSQTYVAGPALLHLAGGNRLLHGADDDVTHGRHAALELA